MNHFLSRILGEVVDKQKNVFRNISSNKYVYIVLIYLFLLVLLDVI